jgi:hypothetical protein
MSELALLSGLLFKNTQRVTVDDNDLWGVVRVGGDEYKLRAYRQRILGRWTLKLEPVVVCPGKAARAKESRADAGVIE